MKRKARFSFAFLSFFRNFAPNFRIADSKRRTTEDCEQTTGTSIPKKNTNKNKQ
jgi:hypothetical protein